MIGYYEGRSINKYKMAPFH